MGECKSPTQAGFCCRVDRRASTTSFRNTVLAVARQRAGPGDDRPKQFCALSGGETLLKQTRQRVGRMIPASCERRGDMGHMCGSYAMGKGSAKRANAVSFREPRTSVKYPNSSVSDWASTVGKEVTVWGARRGWWVRGSCRS